MHHKIDVFSVYLYTYYAVHSTLLHVAKKYDKNPDKCQSKKIQTAKEFVLALHCIHFWRWGKFCLTWLKILCLFFPTGATEAEAKQGALQKALGMLPLLFGFKSLPKCSTVEETEVQINTLLRTKGQKDLTYSHSCTLYKSSVELLFKNYTMESKHQKSKKENRNHLTNRILGLLAVEPGKNHKEVGNYKLNYKLMISF